jgi:oligopeptide transport system substrate-binding protein
MRSKRWLPVITLLTSLSMVLSACGGEATTNPTATQPASVAATSTVGGAIATTAATVVSTPMEAVASATTASGPGDTKGAIKDVLRYSLTSEPAQLDPQAMSFVDEIGTGELVFEGLMALNEKLEPVPAAAEKMDISADGLKYTLTVRDGLKYSDGTPLTAKNFEYAWKRLFDPRVPNRQYSFVAFDIAGSEELDATSPDDAAAIQAGMDKLGVKALNDKTIEFTLKQKAAYFPYILTLWTGWPSRQDLVEAGGEKWTTDKTGKYYVGNGPFVLKEYNAGQMRFEANPYYRKGQVKIKELRAVIIPDVQVAFQSYKKGEIDVLTIAAEDYQSAKTDPSLAGQLKDIPGSCNFYVGFNVKKAPFDNIKVRQAFAQAMDRDDYQKNIAKGLGQAAVSFIPPGRPGYAPDIKGWAYNVEEAKKTLADAGFANGAGLPPIKLTYAARPTTKTRMEWVQNQIKTNLGINMELDPVDPKLYTELVKEEATTPQVFFLGWCQDFPDPQNWLTTVFHSASTVTHVGWKNDEFDRLTKEADVETDATKRIALYHQAHEILVQEAPAVFLYWDVNPTLIKPYIKNMAEHVTPQDHNIPGIMNIENIEVAP